jgi:DNA-binding CsgD family transcriptional regulator
MPRPKATDEAERLSSLIGDVYDASLDPSRWPAVLARSASFLGGATGSIISKDAVSKGGNVFFHDGAMDPHYIQLYFDKYGKLDPSTTAHYFAEIGQPISLVDIMPREEFVETQIYKEWTRPQGLLEYLSVALDKTATSVALFGVMYREKDGLADFEARRRMRLLAPHVRRAVLIARVIELKTTQAETFAEMLDGLSSAMFLVSAEGRIVHANAAGHAMLVDASFLYAVGGHLVATDPDADRTLRELFAAAGLDDSAVGTSGISIPLPATKGTELVAHALPLTSGLRRDTGDTYKAAAALFVHKASPNVAAPPETIAKTYRLTPMELRVLLAIVEIGGATDVADALGVAESTVKTHLKGLYRKTGASRHADLVKLMAKFSSPLV